ncbi:MAG: 16S rRNA (cytosine(967)-C(5))-methyltransferase RsmB [Candidatus Methylomirabilales bacterium]
MGTTPKRGVPSSRLGNNPRQLALEILVRVERDRAYANVLLDARLRRQRLNPRDRALATELCYGVLRHRGTIDFLLSRVVDRPLEAVDLDVRNLLRLGAYQLFYLTRIPAYAAVHETVRVARRGAGSFVNAILRALARRGPLREEELPEDPVHEMAVRFSHPPWLVERWRKQLGDEALQLMQANNRVPPVGIGWNVLRGSVAGLEEALMRAGAAWETSPWVPNMFRVREAGTLLTGSARDRGAFWVMDEAAAVVVRLLDPRPGERVLDACAGGGGKAALAAMLMENRGEVVALDVSPRALRRLQDGRRRLGATITSPVRGDARVAAGQFAGWADRVLVDAPCTGLGTVRRRPEIRWHRGSADISRLAELQGAILDGAADCLRPGGVLVYAVCSREPEEGEEIVARFLARHPAFCREDSLPDFFRGGRGALLTEGCVATWPHRHDTDGYFAARLRRH